MRMIYIPYVYNIWYKYRLFPRHVQYTEQVYVVKLTGRVLSVITRNVIECFINYIAWNVVRTP